MKKGLMVTIPVLGTRGIVIFPSQEIVIEVGRDVSLNAVYAAETLADKFMFVLSQKDASKVDLEKDNMYSFGTLCSIKGYRKKDGFIKLTLVGVQRAKLVTLYDGERYWTADIELCEDVVGDSIEELALIKQVGAKLENYASTTSNFPNEIIGLLSEGISARDLSDRYCQYITMNYDLKQRFLETLSINERLLMVIQHMETENQMKVVEQTINAKVKERIDDGQKEYYLREKMRAIKEELGDVSNLVDDTAEIRRLVQENPYPQHVKDKILEECTRFEMLPAASGEASVVRTYIDWLLKTPWYQTTEDNGDLDVVLQRLNEDHYGLEKIKDRIMEYIAVKEMTNSLSAPILCLVGPPGVGKTSLTKSIARAIDRKFVKISLGGVRDESEIRGHRRTYLGSMPGRIIQGMKKAGVINPVFLIDEIDKMGADYKGDPSSAMLEVLDPEQNKTFSDHYIEENYDLSQVMFIATANYLDEIPHALQDRLEIIHLSSYTEVEKMNIAINHLIPKQCKMNGLTLKQFKCGEEELLYLIRHYTREAGVRQLERVIASLCRKTVLAILKEKKKSVKITNALINTWLGKELFEYGTKEATNQVGVVTGLAYTSFGGDVLQVEVTYFEGKGKLNVTGKLGEVMKESTEIALDYIKSNATKLNIDATFFEKHDIHIHVPEGAVPKDGPSAGITLTTALVSAITNIPVYSDIAMTGEVTLRGHVLPIGGLKEKSLAAHRIGIKKIIIPKKNVKDLDDIPESVRKDIVFYPVEFMDEVLKEALVKQ